MERADEGIKGNDEAGAAGQRAVYPRALVDRLLVVAVEAESGSLAMEAATVREATDAASNVDGLVKGLAPIITLATIVMQELLKLGLRPSPVDRWDTTNVLRYAAQRARLLAELAEHLGPQVDPVAWSDWVEPAEESDPPRTFTLRREVWDGLSESERDWLRRPTGSVDPAQLIEWEVRSRWVLSAPILCTDNRWRALDNMRERFGLLCGRLDLSPACRVCGGMVGTKRRDQWADATQTVCVRCASKPEEKVEPAASASESAPVDAEILARVTEWTDRALVEVERFAIESEDGPLAVACLRWRNGLGKGWASDSRWVASNGTAIITALCDDAATFDADSAKVEGRPLEKRIEDLHWSLAQIKAVAELTASVAEDAK